MRSALRLLTFLAVLLAVSTVCLCMGVSAWLGETAGMGMPAGLGVVTPMVPAPGAGAGSGRVITGVSPAAAAVSWALARLGTPYRWGGEGGGGFDCSGLVQAAFGAAGVALPRVAQDQYEAGPHLPRGTPLRPGDLVFFGSSAAAVDHVGIAVGTAEMIDAPHTGAVVRVEPIWSNGYVGATRPAS
jgi:cell wall-associated NlpC family hydrolase